MLHRNLSLEEVVMLYKTDKDFREQIGKKKNRNAVAGLLVEFSSKGDLTWVKDVLSHNVFINGKINEVSALYIACDRGHRDVVLCLLEHGAATDLRCVRNETALTRATLRGDIEIVTLLLNHGANVNLRDDFGRTALHYASFTGTLDVAIVLLNRGADANLFDKQGLTPLMMASQKGDVGMVSEFLNRGVRLTDRNRQGVGALVFAIKEQHGQVASLLLDQDIDVNDQWNRVSPLAVTIMGSRLHPTLESITQGEEMSMEPEPESRAFTARILELLLGLNADPFAPSGELGWSPLNMAAVLGHTDVMDKLLSTGIDPNEVTAPGTTPLQQACTAGRLDMASLLLEQGADIELKNQEGETCLFYAVWSGNLDLVEFLVNHGANVNTEDKRGATPLEVAVRHDHPEMVALVVGAGADINARVGENSNILELASQLKAESVIGVLIDSGARFPEELDEAGDRILLAQERISRAAHAGDLRQALELLQHLDDPEAADSNAATILKAATGNRDLLTIDQILNEYPKVKIEDALTVAAEKGDLELLNIYLERSLSSEGRQTRISFGPALRAAVRKGHLQAFELLRKRSTDLQTDSELRQTLIVIAASEANVKATKRLLDLGIGQDAGRLNSGGMRALRLAVHEKNEKIINLLVQAGSLSHEDIGRQSDPVMVISAIRNDIHLAKKLANRGADINATGRNGFTALMTAANRGHTEMAKLLLMRGADINLKDDRGRTALDHAIGRNRIDIMALLRASGAKPSQEMD